MMTYKFALDELETKVEILIKEFQLLHDYNPIEHTKSRIKTPESILRKLKRKGVEVSLSSIKKHVKDIAGMRIICSFRSDIYRLSHMLQKQRDLTVLEVQDYIKNPKPNGYQSLHLLVEVPVYMSDREERVCAEIQIRTIAMDFWASLEHKIYYKYKKAVPPYLLQELKAAADSVTALDQKMEWLHNEISNTKDVSEEEEEGLYKLTINDQQIYLPTALRELFTNHR
ncbi:MAG: GTP pyrophosphokinase [Zhaonellaceae bacterium]